MTQPSSPSRAGAPAREPFPRTLQRLREARGWTQKQLAGKAGCTVSTVSRYERGLVSPRLDAVHDLARALGVPATELVLAGVARPGCGAEVAALARTLRELQATCAAQLARLGAPEAAGEPVAPGRVP